MEALLEWLKKDVPADQFWLYIVGSIVIVIIYDLIFSIIAKFFGIKLCRGIKIPINWVLLSLLYLMALLEEIIFRLPLVFFIWLVGPSALVIWIAIVLSILFGLVHGRFACIFVQGVVGFIFCLVFLKFGGINGLILVPLIAASLVHFFTNLILIIAVRLGGKEHIEL